MLKNMHITQQMSETILVVDDEPSICELIYAGLSQKGYAVLTASNGHEALNILKRLTVTVVIADIRMPKMSGETLLRKIKELFPSIPVVIITGYGSIDGAVEVMKKGATYYLPKPFTLSKLHEVVENSICDNRGREKTSRRIITADPRMLEILKMVEIVAKANRNTSILIQGESGTGKELIARAIHESSNPPNMPFVAVNCAALPETLLESELFGYEQGAFTGAITRRIGKFELAHRGTLLMDEIAEMPLSLQVKLLRSIQEGEIDRLGGNSPIKVDVRIIATTNRDIRAEVEKGRFRVDLFFRLYVVPIVIPPLRERKVDISLLVYYFLDKFTREFGKNSLSISKEALEALESYSWPGNVREVENAMERAVMLCCSDVLTIKDFFLDEPLVKNVGHLQNFDGAKLYDVEKYLITRTLDKVGGNKTRAAEILGITTRTIRNKLSKYKMEQKDNNK